jgi:chromosome segregation ATPase
MNELAIRRSFQKVKQDILEIRGKLDHVPKSDTNEKYEKLNQAFLSVREELAKKGNNLETIHNLLINLEKSIELKDKQTRELDIIKGGNIREISSKVNSLERKFTEIEKLLLDMKARNDSTEERLNTLEKNFAGCEKKMESYSKAKPVESKSEKLPPKPQFKTEKTIKLKPVKKIEENEENTEKNSKKGMKGFMKKIFVEDE